MEQGRDDGGRRDGENDIVVSREKEKVKEKERERREQRDSRSNILRADTQTHSHRPVPPRCSLLLSPVSLLPLLPSLLLPS